MALLPLALAVLLLLQTASAPQLEVQTPPVAGPRNHCHLVAPTHIVPLALRALPVAPAPLVRQLQAAQLGLHHLYNVFQC